MTDSPYRIVTGIGFTDACATAVRDSFDLARRVPGAEAHFTTVVDRPKMAKGAEALMEAETRLAKFVRDATKDAPHGEVPTTYHVRIGNVVDALHQVAFDVDANIIVVGTRARSRAIKLVLGSVAESLLTAGRFPILVARPHDTSGMTKTQKPDARRPGEPLRSNREDMLTSSERVDFGRRDSHVSGLV